MRFVAQSVSFMKLVEHADGVCSGHGEGGGEQERQDWEDEHCEEVAAAMQGMGPRHASESRYLSLSKR